MTKRLQCILCQEIFHYDPPSTEEKGFGHCPACDAELEDETFVVDLGPAIDARIARLPGALDTFTGIENKQRGGSIEPPTGETPIYSATRENFVSENNEFADITEQPIHYSSTEITDNRLHDTITNVGLTDDNPSHSVFDGVDSAFEDSTSEGINKRLSTATALELPTGETGPLPRISTSDPLVPIRSEISFTKIDDNQPLDETITAVHATPYDDDDEFGQHNEPTATTHIEDIEGDDSWICEDCHKKIIGKRPPKCPHCGKDFY